MWIMVRGMYIFRHRVATWGKESIHRGAPHPCGARPKAAPMLSLFNVVVLCLRMHTLRAIIRVLCTLGVICVLFHHSHIFPTF